MSDVVLHVENLWKQYRLGVVGTGTMKDDIGRWWAKIRGKEDPTLKIGEANDRNAITGEYVWALQDINFEVKRGEVLGIIGKNGAGKSTLLKILSKVTTPTKGSIKTKGRIASLLEVGTGFHPELTGRENIYLNGAILGMDKAYINTRFDEIVEFSGIGKYIDTPVKRYSSGMYVRLAFAVAAHLEPEILIIDEVLAVGDAEFQKKCLGKMKDVAGEGRTVLFVSHNMTAVTTLCHTGLFLKNGKIINIGTSKFIVDNYINSENFIRTSNDWSNQNIGDEKAKLLSAQIIDEAYNPISNVYINKKIGVQFKYEILDNDSEKIPNIHIFNSNSEHIFVSAKENIYKNHEKGVYLATTWIPSNLLNTGTYIVGLALSTMVPVQVHFFEQNALIFEAIEDLNNRQSDYNQSIPGSVRPKLDWELKTIE